jgi:hypothetical protein
MKYPSLPSEPTPPPLSPATLLAANVFLYLLGRGPIYLPLPLFVKKRKKQFFYLCQAACEAQAVSAWAWSTERTTTTSIFFGSESLIFHFRKNSDTVLLSVLSRALFAGGRSICHRSVPTSKKLQFRIPIDCSGDPEHRRNMFPKGSRPYRSQRLLAAAVFLQMLSSAASQFSQTYQSSDSYYERYLLDSPYNLCRDPLMRRSKVTGTSEASQRGANYAILWGGSAWTTENSDFDQVPVLRLLFFKGCPGGQAGKRTRDLFYFIYFLIPLLYR